MENLQAAARLAPALAPRSTGAGAKKKSRGDSGEGDEPPRAGDNLLECNHAHASAMQRQRYGGVRSGVDWTEVQV